MAPTLRLFLLFVALLLPGLAAAQSITVTSPAAGSEHCQGRKLIISWSKSGKMASEVMIMLMHPNGQTVARVIANRAPNSGRYIWMRADSAPGDYLIDVKVLATAYSSSVWETDSTPTVTAANTLTRPGTLAVSRDLLCEFTPGAPFSFGDRVHVHGIGEFLVEDVMNARWDNRIDIWFPSREEALWFGRRPAVLSRALGARPGDAPSLLSGSFSVGIGIGGL